MDKVKAVIQYMPDPTRGKGDPGQLPVHRIQKGHEPGTQQSKAEVSLNKEPGRSTHQHPTEPGHHIRTNVEPG